MIGFEDEAADIAFLFWYVGTWRCPDKKANRGKGPGRRIPKIIPYDHPAGKTRNKKNLCLCLAWLRRATDHFTLRLILPRSRTATVQTHNLLSLRLMRVPHRYLARTSCAQMRDRNIGQ